MTIPVQITFDCADPDRLAHFWAELLGYELDPPPPGYDSWEAWLTEHGVPERKQLKNRVHLDVNVGGPRGTPDEERRAAVDAAVERANGLGATTVRLVEERGERHYVMNDIEGNEFCLQ